MIVRKYMPISHVHTSICMQYFKLNIPVMYRKWLNVSYVEMAQCYTTAEDFASPENYRTSLNQRRISHFRSNSRSDLITNESSLTPNLHNNRTARSRPHNVTFTHYKTSYIKEFIHNRYRSRNTSLPRLLQPCRTLVHCSSAPSAKEH